MRHVLLKPIFKLSHYIPKLTLQTVLTHSSTVKSAYEDGKTTKWSNDGGLVTYENVRYKAFELVWFY